MLKLLQLINKRMFEQSRYAFVRVQALLLLKFYIPLEIGLCCLHLSLPSSFAAYAEFMYKVLSIHYQLI